MKREIIGMGDAYGAGLIARPGIAFAFPAPAFSFHAVCRDRYGNIKWEETFRNLVTTEGKNSLLDVYFDGATQITTWYLGLKGTGSAAAGDTLASHAGWSEVTPYSGNRPSITFGEPSSGSLVASSAVSYTITGTATVAGAFIGSAASGTTGTLYSAGDFSVSRDVVADDTLNVTPTVSAS
jgi:hypothetical protein